MEIVKQTKNEEIKFKRELKNQLEKIQKNLKHVNHFANKDLIESNIPLLIHWLKSEYICKYFMEVLNHFITYIKEMESVSKKYHITENFVDLTTDLETFLKTKNIHYKNI